jgi:NADH:ubiquinone oxidoreductase subunit 5 (subunit L)/multisubunit Na+/H+ antiporter MnhA subunit
MGGTAMLALVGGLAALCFVRLVGVVLLGAPRSEGAVHAHESPPAMIAPMWILVGACIAFGLAAPSLVAAQASVQSELQVAIRPDVESASSILASIALLNLALLLSIGIVFVLVASWVGKPPATETWGCGYAAPTSRMQYSGRGFSELLTTRALPRWLRPRLRVRPPEGVFPAEATLTSDLADPLTRGAYEPLLVRAGDYFARLRFLQQGNLHVYVVYVLIAMMGGLAWVALREWPAW